MELIQNNSEVIQTIGGFIAILWAIVGIARFFVNKHSATKENEDGLKYKLDGLRANALKEITTNKDERIVGTDKQIVSMLKKLSSEQNWYEGLRREKPGYYRDINEILKLNHIIQFWKLWLSIILMAGLIAVGVDYWYIFLA
jgi:hypothetical protein